MSVMYCEVHDKRYDSDVHMSCPSCINKDEIRAQIERLMPRAETGEQWAEICRLEELLYA